METPSATRHMPFTFATPQEVQNGDHRVLHNNVFRPPLTPASAYLSSNFASKRNQLPVTHREARTDSSTKFRLPNAHGTAAVHGQSIDVKMGTADGPSPAPLANPTYTLANGFDTPTLAATSYYEKYESLDFKFRTDWDEGEAGAGSTSFHLDALTGPLARERNGHARLNDSAYNTEAPNSSWGGFVLNLATSMAGKIVSFCRESAFRGFHAGKGIGYDFASPTELDLDHDWDGYFRSSTPIPGQFPHERRSSHNPDRECTSQPNKRLHTETAGDWVVVENNLHTRESSPRLTTRKISNPLLAAPRLPTSRASCRRSLIPTSRRAASSNIAYTGSPFHTQLNSDHMNVSPISSQHAQDRRVSSASARSPLITNRKVLHDQSPLSSQAQKILAKRNREDKDTDKSIRKMSRQLQDLIKQGQAALGTKFEIEDDRSNGMPEAGDCDDWEDAGADSVSKW